MQYADGPALLFASFCWLAFPWLCCLWLAEGSERGERTGPDACLQKTDKGEGGACVRSGARSHRDGADPIWGCAMNPSPPGTGDRQRAIMMLQTPPGNACVAGGGPANAM